MVYYAVRMTKDSQQNPAKVVPERCYTIRETSEMLRCSQDTLRRYLRKEECKLKTFQLGTRGSIRITSDSVEAMLKGGGIPAA